MNFLNRIIDHSRATLSIMLLILFAGTMARVAMPVEVNPNVTLPVVLIMVRHDGISPEDGARLLIRPVEKELKTLDGLDEINATAREGAVYILAEFDISEDIGAVVAEVREAVDRAKAEFPQETKVNSNYPKNNANFLLPHFSFIHVFGYVSEFIYTFFKL